jgi:hypothetical protein
VAVVRKGGAVRWGRKVGGAGRRGAAAWAPLAAGGGGDRRWQCWSVESKEKIGNWRKKKGRER